MKQYKELTSELRYQIYGLKQAGLNQTEIAKKMGVDKGTIVLAKLVVNLCRGCRGFRFKICIVILRPAILTFGHPVTKSNWWHAFTKVVKHFTFNLFIGITQIDTHF